MAQGAVLANSSLLLTATRINILEASAFTPAVLAGEAHAVRTLLKAMQLPRTRFYWLLAAVCFFNAASMTDAR